ncbi:hydroxysqualene dehydroxylase HpnE [Rhodocyclus tenuis]|uniref:Squalene-associated FAD-dependent desaturase n=1 Tax=Rhodocyclus tenuis TaxID=1066 RepID=A0A840G6R9_RHOTE|nr:hydroxysqualene dehydroxylase HpnE [Rhodocyclus tenuis]MBB4247565.1 squalene-associated FAD-dependent desaturase [Rhodocyclus tenuis]
MGHRLNPGPNHSQTPGAQAAGRVAIVGGGWAGLAAGVELAAAGVPVVVFEAARSLGGRARSVDRADGSRLDNGQHILLGAYSETLRLMQRVGADPERLLHRQALDLRYPGSASAAPFRLHLPRLPAPLHLAVGLLAAEGLTFADRLAAVRFMRSLQTRAWTLPADESVAALLEREGQGKRGSRLRRRLWEPLCLSALNTPACEASAQVFVNVLRDSLGGTRAATDLLLPAADLGRIFPEPAAAFIAAHRGEVRVSTRVSSIEVDDSSGAFIVRSTAAGAADAGGAHAAAGDDGGGERFAQIIVATAAPAAARLLAPWPAIAAPFAALTQAPIGTLYLGYPPEVRLPFPLLGLDGEGGGAAALAGQPADQTPLGQWVFDRGQLCATPGVLSFVLSGSGAWEAFDAAALGQRLQRELETALGERLPPPLWRQLISERRATFDCLPGLARPACRTAQHGLWLAGDFVCAGYPATLEGAVRSGVAAARAILTD